MIEIANYSDLDVQLSQSDRVLLYFSASWCQPCAAFSPTVNQISTEFSKILTTVKIDVERVPEAVGKYAIKSIPTLLLIDQQVVVEGAVGAQTKDELAKWLTSHILTY